MTGDAEDWVTSRVKTLHDTKEDEQAVIGFLSTTLGFHPLGPFTRTVDSIPVESVVVRSNGNVERKLWKILDDEGLEEKSRPSILGWSAEVYFETEKQAKEFGKNVKSNSVSALVEIWGPVTE